MTSSDEPAGAGPAEADDPEASGPADERAGDPGLATTLRAYQDSRYEDTFWPSRRYEDGCDRLAIRAFLPSTGDRILEVGAGYGRLASEYGGYREIVLLDAAAIHVEGARRQLAGDPRVAVVQGDAFRLPFADASFDVVVCVRVIHHFENPQPAIAEFARVLRPGGVLILESSNKRNLKAIAYYLLHRQRWSPFARGTVHDAGEYLLPESARQALSTLRGDDRRPPPAKWVSPTTAFDHAPADVRRWIMKAGMRPAGMRTVSNLRMPALTRRVSARLLLAIERPCQRLLAPVTPGPSLFFRAVRAEDRPGPA